MPDIKVLTAEGEFALSGDLRRLSALTLEDGVLFEYIADTFNNAIHDSNNRLLHIRMACVRKYGQVTRKRVSEDVIRRIYEFAKGKEDQNTVDIVDNLPLEQSTKIFLDVIRRALDEKAVDVHWVVRRNGVAILFRIHGRIERIKEFSFDRDFATGLLGAIYSSSKDVTDGSFSPRNRSACSLYYNDPPVAIRWQTIPTGDSEGLEYDVVLRITPQNQEEKRIPTLEELGYLPDQAALLTAACNSPGGIIMSGMTGSGKTTALRSLMNIIRGSGDKKIYTVEDPIELKIYGATQISARGHNVADILHALLRGDMDVVMVGEVRDSAVARAMETVVRSGHKMLTTIHAPSALAIISRLSSPDIGIQRETLAEPNFISVLVYQMLIPTLCSHCKIPVREQPEKIEPLAFHLFSEHRFGLNESSVFLRNENGCSHCRHGIGGMTVCAEVIRPTHEINCLLRDRKDSEALFAYRSLRNARFDEAGSIGKTAYEVAIYKVSQGIIDPWDVNDMFGDMSLQEIMRSHYEMGDMS